MRAVFRTGNFRYENSPSVSGVAFTLKSSCICGATVKRTLNRSLVSRKPSWIDGSVFWRRISKLPARTYFSKIAKKKTHQVHGRAPGRVWLHEELRWRLPKVPDLGLHRLPHGRVVVGHGLEVRAALVRQVVEHVGRADGLGA